MHAHYKIGLLFIILLCTSYSISADASEETNLFDEEDYVEEYYDNDDDGVYRGFSDDNNIRPETTTIKPTSNSTKMMSDIFIDLPKVDLKCPENCDCADENQFINCSGKHLGQVPKNIPETALRIDLSHNSISELTDDDFVNCTNLREIFLNGNEINSISKEVFSNLKRLDRIDLSSNMLTEIDPETFLQAAALSMLNLSNNAIILSEDSSFLNQPKLKELYLVNSSITELYDNTFRNLSGLTSLAINGNNFNEKINTKAFESLKNLGKLRLPEIEQDNIKELCNVLPSIDVISLKDFDVSCFELVAGTSFDESIITREGERPRKLQPRIEPVANRSTATGSQRNKELFHGSITTMSPPGSLTTLPNSNESGKMGQQPENNNNSSVTTSDDEEQTYQVAVSSQTIQQILIGIIIVAAVGLIIGIICRRDLCGIKTKLCRTRRPPTTDQVRPAEEIPLNKV